jgi:hypothetical protein
VCGIAGVLRRASSRDTGWSILSSMSEAISHRGPDGHGYFASGPVGLAHRLAIIDIEGVCQQIEEGRGLALVQRRTLQLHISSRRDGKPRRHVRYALRHGGIVPAGRRSFARLGGSSEWHVCVRVVVRARARTGAGPPSARNHAILLYASRGRVVFASEVKALLQLRQSPAPTSGGASSPVFESLALGVPLIAAANGARPAAVLTYAAEAPAELSETILPHLLSATRSRHRCPDRSSRIRSLRKQPSLATVESGRFDL